MEEEHPLPQNSKQYDRRRFLTKSLTLFAGACLGLNLFSRADAEERAYYPIGEPPWAKHPDGLSPAGIALIIDDIGSSVSRARAFLALGVPITFAVLPRLRYSVPLAQEIHALGHEIMLHQPMEPYSREIDPGPGAVYVAYNAPEIEEIVEKNLSEIPQATGVNNHMGSRFTSCPSKVVPALKIIKQKNLFFVDSLTTCHSKAYQMARSLHMRTAPRNVFLDDCLCLSAIRRQLRELKDHALRHGAAIGIGHPHLETLTALHEFKWELSQKGNVPGIVPVSHLL